MTEVGDSGCGIDIANLLERPMRKVPIFSRSMLWLLPAGWFWATISVTAASDVKFTKQCAEREVRVITLIEDHGAAVPALVDDETLSTAGLMLIEARARCYDGREAEAIVIYDRIAAILGPVTPTQTH